MCILQYNIRNNPDSNFPGPPTTIHASQNFDLTDEDQQYAPVDWERCVSYLIHYGKTYDK